MSRTRGNRHRVDPEGAPPRWRSAARGALLVALVAGLVTGVGGVAWAAWSSAAAGSSAGRATTAQPPTTTAVAGSAVTSGLLYPTGTGSVVITVNNPNPYRVKVASIAAAGAVTAAGGTGTCSTTGVTLTAQTPGDLVPAGGSVTLTLAGAAAMSASSDAGCQGATFTLPVTVTVESA